MTEKELLEDCLTAFAAIPVSAASRRLLKKWGMEPAPYAGDGRHLLAEYMAKKIRGHLASEEAERHDALTPHKCGET